MAEVSASRAVTVDRARGSVLAHGLTALLVSDIAIATARMVVPLPTGRDAHFHDEIALRPVVVLWRLAVAVTVVVFLTWFYRERVRAEESDWRQRRARGWAFWGWIVPVADLWVPFQLMRDIWRAGQLPSQRASFPWLPALWWASWLLTGLLSRSWSTNSRNGGYGLILPASWISYTFLAIAGITLIAICQTLHRRS